MTRKERRRQKKKSEVLNRDSDKGRRKVASNRGLEVKYSEMKAGGGTELIRHG